jgi:hypothetical protein
LGLSGGAQGLDKVVTARQLAGGIDDSGQSKKELGRNFLFIFRGA